MANSRRNQKEESFDSFDYVLNDFLEIKAEVDPGRAQPLRSYLLSLKEKNPNLSLVEGFRFNGHLVLIEKDKPGRLRRLVFFNPHRGSIRIREI